MLHLPLSDAFPGGPNITSPSDTEVTVVAHAGRQRTEGAKRALAPVLRAGRGAGLLPQAEGPPALPSPRGPSGAQEA